MVQEGDSVAVHWAACPAVQAELQAHYRIAGPESLDATFVDAQDAYHFVQILDALYDSAQRREKVMID